MLNVPEIVRVNEQLTAVIHLTIPRTEIQSVMEPAISEIISCLTAQGISPEGALFSYHLNRPTDIFDFEVGFPVARKITPVGRVKTSNLPAVQVARTVYRGSYEGLGAAWGEFFDWIKQEGLNAQGSLWECYMTGPESSPDPSAWETELNSPLTP